MFLNVSQLSVRYAGQSQAAVDGVSLGLRAGDIGVLIGPSGCGKTTLLRAVAGLERASGGSITLDGETVSDSQHHMPAEQRRIGMVFQDYALFPHLDVGRNIAFGIERLPRAEREARVDEVLRLVGLAGMQARFPHELSGGQQQRVALARALAPRPRLLLLDEVAAGLTESEVDAMAQLIRRLRDELDLTVIWIEHAVTTLLRCVERVIVLHQGRKIADGTPAEVVRHAEVIEAYLGDEMVGTA
ncbi:MAG: ABC transporter ATP-binding protein [Hydrogenophaga sp.]|nr:ABC transporter ATP-binding protein [Hydrogenophaga sp.]